VISSLFLSPPTAAFAGSLARGVSALNNGGQPSKQAVKAMARVIRFMMIAPFPPTSSADISHTILGPRPSRAKQSHWSKLYPALPYPQAFSRLQDPISAASKVFRLADGLKRSCFLHGR
jgi:hypothetical protein